MVDRYITDVFDIAREIRRVLAGRYRDVGSREPCLKGVFIKNSAVVSKALELQGLTCVDESVLRSAQPEPLPSDGGRQPTDQSHAPRNGPEVGRVAMLRKNPFWIESISPSSANLYAGDGVKSRIVTSEMCRDGCISPHSSVLSAALLGGRALAEALPLTKAEAQIRVNAPKPPPLIHTQPRPKVIS